MAWRLAPFADIGLTPDRLDTLLADHEQRTEPRLRRLWAYYRNPGALDAPEHADARAAQRLAQAAGLPRRLRGRRDRPDSDDRAGPPEVVIENDIAWRVDAMVDFVFGRPLSITSTAHDPQRRATIEAALAAAIDASGSMTLLQEIALLGGVYGHVDILVDAGELLTTPRPPTDPEQAARLIRLIPVEPPRAAAILDPGDVKHIHALVIRSRQPTDQRKPHTTPGAFLNRILARRDTTDQPTAEIVEIWSAAHHQVYRDAALILSEPNPLGVLPIAHIQNTAQPFAHEGLSDVEPLIPLQDELNTRLSDRAHRVTLQSFNMYLAKGMEGFGPTAIGPGMVWSTDNTDARVEAFGGDASSPSEDRHIEELRAAMDKASGVSPVVLGIIRERLGQLSSETALRVTLTGLINRTHRKRVAYGRAIEHACALILHALHTAGVLLTDEADRRVRLRWEDPLPVDDEQRLRAAKLKLDLGVPRERILEELGYAQPSPDHR